MTTPTRPSRARRVPSAPDAPTPPTRPPADAPVPATPRPRSDRHPIGRDPDGGTGEVHELLVAAVDEAARLLDADGAMVYLLDPATGHLRFAHDAGISSRRSRAWVRSIDLPVGVGMFGRAVAERAVVLTSDYLDDPSFAHAEDTDRVVRDIGIRSMVVAPLVAGETVFGAMGTFSSKLDAFNPSAIALVRALADHAAAAMSNARLIEALDASSRELAERADVERSLREIAARISAAADLPAVLQLGVDEAARLLHADGARIDLIDPDVGLLRWAFASGAVKPDDEVWPDDPDETLDQGISGQAVVTGRAFWSGDYIADMRFPHGPGADQYITTTGLRSVMAAPLIVESGPIGALTVFSSRPDAWEEADSRILEAIADQAAITIRTTRLFDELDQSRRALARRAEAEQALREIAARITVLREPTEILQDVVTQAARLVGADGVILDLLDEATGYLRWAMDDGLSEQFTADERAGLWIAVGVGATGIALAEDRVVLADDDLVSLFPPSPESTEFYERTGFHSMIAAPITGDSGPLGVIEVYARRPAAFTGTDAGLVGALASQAAIAITNARLIEELARSRGELARTADAERTLREIAGRVSATHDQDEILQAVIDAAVRLLGATGAMIDLVGEAGMAEAWTSREEGVRASSNLDLLSEVTLEPDAGVSGRAIRSRRVEWTGDYLADDRFMHTQARDAFVRESGIRSVIAAPLIHREVVVGAITVYGDRGDAFDTEDAALLAALADQAAISIANARLVDQLERSQAAVAWRADTERALRDITARIAALREPEVILHRVVDEAKRLLGTDGAHLTRMGEEGTYLVPVVVTGATDAETQAWLLDMEFPLGGGINGLAAQLGQPVWTSDYTADPRIPHEGNDDEVADRLGLCGMAAAPLRAPGGEVIGTLAISSATPRAFDAEELDLLQGLADQAAIAITNSTLLTRLTESEERYRYLVENAPDLVWSIGADTRLTFVSDSVERLTGFRPDDLVGRHFGALVHKSSREVADFDWTSGMGTGSQELRGRVNLLASDGSAIPAEYIATARLDENGAFVGANGSVRDMRERDRLERELQASEARFRNLVQTTPDVIYRCDAEGRFLFMAEGVEALFGLSPAEVAGMTFADLTAAESLDEALANFEIQKGEHDVVRRFRYHVKYRDGTTFPAEITSVSVWEDGTFAGVQGTVRDVTQQERLERELSESQDRYRFLVENSPDVVFSADPEGRFTFMSESMERMTGWRPDALIGEHFSKVIEIGSHAEAGMRWAAIVADPATEQVTHLNLQGPDGRIVPVEVSAIGMTDDEGRFAGMHGSTRDISERYRLERELRESEERYRYLVASSPDLVWLTDAAGTLTFISDAARTMLGIEPTELMGRSYAEIFAPAARRDATTRFRWLARHPAAVHRMRLPFRHADGHDVLVEINGTGMTAEGEFIGAHGAARDVSERDRLERDLRRQAGELAAGEERAHLARELHDSVTQALFSMTLVSRSVEMLLDRDPAAARTQLVQLRDLQREALAEMRALIFELRPGNLEHDGLSRALRTHTAALQGRIGLPVVVESTLEERLSLSVEEVLYRISQEALHNVVKHAGARQVRLELGRIASGVRLRISDDGKGFDPARVPDGHLGLAGMRARADKIDARFSVKSVPGEGTTIEVVVPNAALAAAGAAPAADPASIRDG